MTRERRLGWIAGAGATILVTAYLAHNLLLGDQGAFLIGRTTDGHYQIEAACDSCHVEGFSSPEQMQQACVKCHAAELNAADDSHPRSKFTDPRNAPLLAALDARYCVSCHREHRPEITRPMGVTVPDDNCYHCHRDIADDRPSHRDFAFDGCGAAGCHNFHDNTALYEDFLVKHRDEPDTRYNGRLPRRNLARRLRQTAMHPRASLSAERHDAPPAAADTRIVDTWAGAAHARGGINCSDCHIGDDGRWRDHPGPAPCVDCHARESEGFQQGRHGMRVAAGLTPMQPALARRAMQADAGDKALGCISCHGPHDTDLRHAAVDACLGCHADRHSETYKDSPHFALWRDGAEAGGRKGAGVSCAGCHMPRETIRDRGLDWVRVQHNQNANLRPNEKMLRSVCMHCHGLAFSIDALADRRLITANFNGRPQRHVESMNMALRRLAEGRADTTP